MLRTGLALLAIVAALGAQDVPAWPGFEFSPPEGWIEIDEQGRREFEAAERGRSANDPLRVLAVYAYAPDGADEEAVENGFVYTCSVWHVAFDTLPRKRRRAAERVSVEQIAKDMTPDRVQSEIEGRFGDASESGIVEVRTQPPLVSSERGRITMDKTLVLAVGPVTRARSCLHLGSKAMVRIDFTAPEEHWEGLADTRLAVLNSFRFDKGKGYDRTNRGGSSASYQCGVWTARLIIPGLVIGLVIGLARRRGKVATVPGPGAPEDSDR